MNADEAKELLELQHRMQQLHGAFHRVSGGGRTAPLQNLWWQAANRYPAPIRGGSAPEGPLLVPMPNGVGQGQGAGEGRGHQPEPERLLPGIRGAAEMHIRFR